MSKKRKHTNLAESYELLIKAVRRDDLKAAVALVKNGVDVNYFCEVMNET